MINSVIMDEIEELDSTWVNDFDKLDDEYKTYYSEELSFMKFHLIYVNKNGDIEKVKEEKLLLKTSGVLQKEELLGIIKHSSFLSDIKYSLLSILKFNVNIEPENLKNFLNSKNKHIGSSFLHSIKNINTIHFEKSIAMFHDINEVILLFGVNCIPNTNKRTKKIFIYSNTKNKTKRNELKEKTT